MKAMVVAGLFGLLVLGGCAGKGGVKDGEGSDAAISGAGGVTTSGLGGRGVGAGAGGAAGAYGAAGGPGSLNDPNSPLSKRIIYFDYDSELVPPAYNNVVDAHAAYLAAHPGTHIRIAGHTDERGSREYNLALGDRRAQAVERSLMLKGVPRTQIETISYGEESPAAFGHDEESWQMNRRAVLDYTGQ